VGDVYKQEDAPGTAEDKGKVLNLSASVATVYGSSDDALQTKDFSSLDPTLQEHKFYIRGVGEVLVFDLNKQKVAEQLVRLEIEGGAGDDRLGGQLGLDWLFGNAGDDVLNGRAGTDRLDGGAGDDELTGGRDGDLFVFRAHANGVVESDTITDYQVVDAEATGAANVDRIDLRHGEASVASDALVSGVWHITLVGDGDIIRLPGVADLNQDGHIIDDLLFT
jgi:Ca2+-binding RTX toxin-like protein